MEGKDLTEVTNEVFSRLRKILYERYGDFVPASTIDGGLSAGDLSSLVERLGSFRADEDLLDLSDALRKIGEGTYGRCLFCREEIATARLLANPLTKFCTECEKVLNPRYYSVEAGEKDRRPG